MTQHAIMRARERCWFDVWGVEIRDRIRDEVRSALRAGRAATRKPRDWRLDGDPGRTLLGHQRFVWEPLLEIGWIVAIEPNADVYVLTTITRAAPVGRREEAA